MKFNKTYLNQVKQDLVNDVAQSSYIVPYLIKSTGIYVKPTVKLQSTDIKVGLMKARRKNISQICIDYPDNPYSKLQEYFEQEVYTFLEAFPKYKEVIL